MRRPRIIRDCAICCLARRPGSAEWRGRISQSNPLQQLLNADWDCSGFESGEPSLDTWLKRSAIKTIGAARTYAITVDRSVIGYYALAVGSVSRTAATGSVRRNMPDPVPVMLLARLAIDRRWQGRGLGAALLRDAALRTLQAADIAGEKPGTDHGTPSCLAALGQLGTMWTYHENPD